MATTKVFVLDSNVVLTDAQSLYKFGENEVIIPMCVLEEIDQFKREMTERGRNARHFSHILDDLRKISHLGDGVKLNKQGGILRIELFPDDVPPEMGYLDISTADNQMLTICLELQKRHKNQEVIFITKDINLRVKADALGIASDDFDPSHVSIEELYPGFRYVEVAEDIIDTFFSKKKVVLPDQKFSPNEYVILRNFENKSHTAIGRYNEEQTAVCGLLRPKEGVWGIFPKNVEQSFALDMLLDDSIQLATLVGKAGTGKTLMAIAAGMLQTIDTGTFKKLLVSRPIFPLGRDIGFLPGEIEDKLNPWMQPIFDNLDLLLGGSGSDTKSPRSKRAQSAPKAAQEQLIAQGLISIEPLTYIRGRSIPYQYLIVDEAQNLTPHEVKTIITRAGEGTKIVLTGDCYQIDNPYVDSSNNGLAHVVERFKGERISAHITLQRGERSNLAELATQLL
jgi:PhoH-like ATPase